MAPKLALAALEFGEGNYRPALTAYREVLRGWPACPAEVRLGIAACHFRLGSMARAGAAFQRALDLDPGCTQALLGLAVLRLSAGQTAEVRGGGGLGGRELTGGGAWGQNDRAEEWPGRPLGRAGGETRPEGGGA